MKNKLKLENNFYIFRCPHEECKQYIIVQKNELNCHIFRHGILKNNYEQINQHEKKEICDNFKNNDNIYICSINSDYKENNHLFNLKLHNIASNAIIYLIYINLKLCLKTIH